MNNPRVYIAGYHALVSCFSLDLDAGSLTLLSTSVAGAKPTYMAHHPSGRFMYALDEAQPGRISAYAVDPQDGRLTRLNVVSSIVNRKRRRNRPPIEGQLWQVAVEGAGFPGAPRAGKCRRCAR
jgi:hypothetical protein